MGRNTNIDNPKRTGNFQAAYDITRPSKERSIPNMNETKTVKGFKIFNPDWTCGNKQYTCPGKFEEDDIFFVDRYEMQFWEKATNCFKYHGFDFSLKAAEVIAYGDIRRRQEYCWTNKLEIVREIPRSELLEIANLGEGNIGWRNAGDDNIGSFNGGYWNNGNHNTGYRNIGDNNSGNHNVGNGNSGDWNKCNFSNGCFNTTEQKIYLFNKPSKWTYQDWNDSQAKKLLFYLPVDTFVYVPFEEMTDEEKAEHPQAKKEGGYAKRIDNIKERQKRWNDFDIDEKNAILRIPNFDKKIFKKITGIDVDIKLKTE